MKRLVAAVCMIACLLGATTAAGSAAVGAPVHTTDAWPAWDGFGDGGFADLGDTTLTAGNVTALQPRWTSAGHPTATIMLGSTVFGDGVDSAHGPMLVARAATTGRVLWTVATGGGYITWLASRNGVIYAAAQLYPTGYEVLAISLSVHAVIWADVLDQSDPAQQGSVVQLRADQGQVYFQVSDGSGAKGLFAVDARNGQPLWTLPGAFGQVAAAGGLVAVRANACCGLDGLMLRDGRSGQLLGETGDDEVGAVALIDNMLVLGTVSGLKVWNVKTCTVNRCPVAWSASSGLPDDDPDVVSLTALPGHALAYTVARPSGFGTAPGHVWMRAVTTGSLQRSISLAAGSLRSPPIATSTLLLVALNGALTAIPLACTTSCPNAVRGHPIAFRDATTPVELEAAGKAVILLDQYANPIQVLTLSP